MTGPIIRASHVEQAARIDVEKEIPVPVGGLVHRRAHPEAAGDVAQYLDAPEARADLGKGSFQCLITI